MVYVLFYRKELTKTAAPQVKYTQLFVKSFLLNMELLSCNYSPYRIVSVRIPEQQMKLQLPVDLCICCAFRVLSRYGRHAVCNGLSYIFIHENLPHTSVVLPGALHHVYLRTS